jgi:hypothetical protein
MSKVKAKAVKLELYQYADVSTGHVSREDDRRLHEDAMVTDERQTPRGSLARLETPRLIVFEYDAGYFVHTGAAEDKDRLDELSGRYSKDLLRLLALAFDQGATFLRLDRDGGTYEGLPTHKW